MFEQNNSAKFTFLYLLSLVALAFFVISAGTVIFQIINKNIVDIVETYNTRYSLSSLRFALSAMIVAAPVYLVSVRQINKSLVSGALHNDSAIRKWLTYFITLVTSLVMIGSAIAIINNFLNGELTLKFILKTVTVLGLAASTFFYYIYDIKREDVKDKKDVIIKIYGYATVAVVVIVFVAGIFFVESPAEARQKRLDNENVNRLSTIESAVQNYYIDNSGLPESLDALDEETDFINANGLLNPVTNQQFVYNIIDVKSYELCTDWQRSNMDDTDTRYEYFNVSWQHGSGYDCVKKKVSDADTGIFPKARF